MIVVLQKVNRSGSGGNEEKDELAQEIKKYTDTLQQISS